LVSSLASTQSAFSRSTNTWLFTSFTSIRMVEESLNVQDISKQSFQTINQLPTK
jgi:hypothetical protein